MGNIEKEASSAAVAPGEGHVFPKDPEDFIDHLYDLERSNPTLAGIARNAVVFAENLKVTAGIIRAENNVLPDEDDKSVIPISVDLPDGQGKEYKLRDDSTAGLVFRTLAEKFIDARVLDTATDEEGYGETLIRGSFDEKPMNIIETRWYDQDGDYSTLRLVSSLPDRLMTRSDLQERQDLIDSVGRDLSELHVLETKPLVEYPKAA